MYKWDIERMKIPIDDRSVNVTPESIHRYQMRNHRVCFTDEIPRITMDKLYGTLDHGTPGYYILEGM